MRECAGGWGGDDEGRGRGSGGEDGGGEDDEAEAGRSDADASTRHVTESASAPGSESTVRLSPPLRFAVFPSHYRIRCAYAM